jgi:hypothetical protein
VNARERLGFNITTSGVRDETAETANRSYTDTLAKLPSKLAHLARLHLLVIDEVCYLTRPSHHPNRPEGKPLQDGAQELAPLRLLEHWLAEPARWR